MAPRGRRPKSPNAKALAGNPGKRPLPETLAVVSTTPEPPAFLDGAARDEWDRLVNQLGPTKVLTELDRGTLAMLCQSYSDYVAACQNVERFGEVMAGEKGAYISPYVHLKSMAFKQYKALLAEFGLSPLARVRIVVGREKPKDPLAAFDAEFRDAV
jgi:P27 family predicted phage terminase small subunit